MVGGNKFSRMDPTGFYCGAFLKGVVQMRKNNKFFHFFVVLIYCVVFSGFCGVVHAERSGISCKLNEQNLLIVSGAGEPETDVTINILAPEKTYDDVRADLSALVYHDQTKTSKSGKYSFPVEVFDEGKYTIYVKVGNNEIEQTTFDYVGFVDNPIIFSADFENKTLDGYGLSVLETSGAVGKIATKDIEHGNSMRLTKANLCKVFDEKIQDKCVAISFSYLKERADSLFMLKLASDFLFEEDYLKGTNGRMVFETFFDQSGEASFYTNMTGYTKPADKSNYVEAPVGEWNDVVIYLDYLHSQISYVINGTVVNTAPINSLAYNIKALCWSEYSGGNVWIDDICVREITRADKLQIQEEEVPGGIWQYSNRPINISLNTGKTGNIFKGSDELLWNIEISDREQLKGDYSAEYVVKDEYNKTVWSSSDSFSVDAGGSYKKVISLPTLKYGLYSFNVEVTSDNHEGYQSFAEFSVVNSPASNFENKNFGYCLHVGQGREYEELLPLIEMSGARIVRDELVWDGVENPLGNWHFPEGQVAYWKALSDKGITLLFGLNWGAPGDLSAGWGTAEYNAAYANWAAKMAAKFKELGLNFAIETSNEWNSDSNRTAQQYAALLKATYDAVKAVDKNIKVVGGNYAGAPVDVTKAVIDELNGEKCMDAISIHIYEHGNPLGPETGVWVSYTEPMRELLDSYNNYKDVPIWLSETGWSTMDGWATDREQGAMLTRLAGLNDAKDLWDVVLWYDFQDDGTESDNRENNFGMTEFIWPSWQHPTPYAAKPAYLAMSNYNTLVGNCTFAGEIDCDDDTFIYTYKTTDEKTLMMVGAISGSKNLALNIGRDRSFTVYDMYGNAKSLETLNGILNLAINEEPIYIKGDFEVAELTDSIFALDKTEVKLVPGKTAEFVLSKSDNEEITVSIEADEKISLASKPNFASNKAKIILNTDPSLSGTRKVEINAYSASGVLLFTTDVNLVFIETEFDVTDVRLYASNTELDASREVPATTNKAVLSFNPMPDAEKIDAISVLANDNVVSFEKTVDWENGTVELLFDGNFEPGAECEISIPEYIVRTNNGNKNISYRYTFKIYNSGCARMQLYSGFDINRAGWDYHTEDNIVNISGKSFGANHETALSPHQWNNQYFYEALNTNQAVKRGDGKIIVSFDRYQTTAEGMKILLSLFTDKNNESWEHVLYQSDTGQIGFSNYRQDKPSISENLTTVTPNMNGNWTHYDVVIDLVNNYEYVYIDGVQVGKRNRSWLQSSTVYGVRFETHRKTEVDSSYEGYIDNFVVSYAAKDSTDFDADVRASYGKVDLILGERLPSGNDITSEGFEIYEAISGKEITIGSVTNIDGRILRIASDEITYGKEYILKVNKPMTSMFGRTLNGAEYSFSVPYINGAGHVSGVTFTDSKDTHYAKNNVCTDLSKITVQLSNDISVPTLGDISFMQEDVPVDAIEKYDPINKIYVVELENDLTAKQDYCLTVPSTVKTADGKSFAENTVYGFKAIPFRFGELVLRNESNKTPMYVDGAPVTAQINVEQLKEGIDAWLIVVTYKDGALIGAEIDSTNTVGEDVLSAASNTIENTDDGVYEIKVFVWDNQMVPYISTILNEQ